jgi:ornithine carbamoyltransferase
MKTTKEQQLLLNIYRAIYFDIGVNFDEINKSKQDWFLDYCLPEARQKEILESVLKSKRLTKLKKQAIRNSYYLGVSPKNC